MIPNWLFLLLVLVLPIGGYVTYLTFKEGEYGPPRYTRVTRTENPVQFRSTFALQILALAALLYVVIAEGIERLTS